MSVNNCLEKEVVEYFKGKNQHQILQFLSLVNNQFEIITEEISSFQYCMHET